MRERERESEKSRERGIGKSCEEMKKLDDVCLVRWERCGRVLIGVEGAL